MTIEPGTRLGTYEVLSRLGAGGMGEVYLAQDTRLDRKVALKVLPPEFASDEGRLRRFVQEAKSAAGLSHPNIAHIYEVGEADGLHFIAMEFVDGDTLSTKLHANPQLATLLKYLLQAAEGLARAHSAGIVHRDLKPDNIMITRDGYAKILDFGLAKIIEPQKAPGDSLEDAATAMMPAQPLSVVGTVMGTIGYMSPEQAQGKTVDQRSDIFSFGCILYEAATGKRAFAGDSAIDSLHKIIYSEAPPIADLNPAAPADLQRIVRRCLAKEPEKRYQTIRDVANDLEDLRRDFESEIGRRRSSPALSAATVVASVPVTASSPSMQTASSAEYIVTEMKRHKTGAMTILAILIVAGLAIAYAVYRISFQSKPAVAHFQSPKFTRLTTEGNVNSVIVSPDGKYLAYALTENGKLSLWTKHLATGSRVQIAPPSDATVMFTSGFTGDGSYVYYIVRDEQNPQGALYQVPVLGGSSKKILSDINTPIAFSPDGKQFEFGRYDTSTNEFSLFIANVDGSNEHRILARNKPESLGQNGAAWSPDGKLIAVGYGNQEGGSHMEVAVVQVDNGSLKPITTQRWKNIGRVAWLSDGSGLAVIAQDRGANSSQIWQVSYPSGEASRITNDLNSYSLSSLTLTADSTALITVQNEATINVWLMPDGETSRARALTSRKNVREGVSGLGWTPDGKLAYDSDLTGKQSLWAVNTDGTDQKKLLETGEDGSGAGMSPDGRYFVFFSFRSQTPQIWRTDLDGGNPKQLTDESGIRTSSMSPDGRWVIYTPLEGGIKKVSIDGGPAIKLCDDPAADYPEVSPDGKLLAYSYLDNHTKRPKFNIIPSDGGAPIKTLDLPVTAFFSFGWSPDSRALIYINTLGGASNLWRQALDGGAPKQITSFTTDLIYNFCYSRDGKQIALARGSTIRDAVMINDNK